MTIRTFFCRFSLAASILLLSPLAHAQERRSDACGGLLEIELANCWKNRIGTSTTRSTYEKWIKETGKEHQKWHQEHPNPNEPLYDQKHQEWHKDKREEQKRFFNSITDTGTKTRRSVTRNQNHTRTVRRVSRQGTQEGDSRARPSRRAIRATSGVEKLQNHPVRK